MQIVFDEDNLHEMSNPVFKGTNNQKHFKMSFADLFTR